MDRNTLTTRSASDDGYSYNILKIWSGIRKESRLVRQIFSAILLLSLISAYSIEAYCKDKTWSWDTEVGYVETTGNSKSASANVSSEYNKKWKRAILTLRGTHISASQNDITNAESYSLSEKVDVPLNLRFYLYQLLGWEKDRFAGIDYRYNIQLGGGYKILDTEKNRLSGEVGNDYTIEKYTSGDDESFGSLKGYLKYVYSFSEHAKFSQEGEILYNLERSDDTRVNSITALSASLSANLALKISYTIKYDKSPAPGFKKTDTILTSSIILRL